MRAYLVLIPIFILSLFQGVFLPLSLVLWLVLVWGVVRPVRESLAVGFFSGLFLDLSLGNPLGFSGLLFLIFILIGFGYSRRFDSAHPAFLSVFIFLSSAAYSLILGEPWLVRSLVLVVLTLLVTPLIRYHRLDSRDLRLKLKT